jgi:RHS repeat-associated protein
VDADNDGHIDILVHVNDRWNCNYGPGTGPVTCKGSAMRISGGDHNWAPGPKVQNQLNFRPAATDDTAQILYDGSVRRDFRQQIQQGTVIDPRLAQTTAFTYKANDGAADSAPATVAIDIKPANSPPVITSIPPSALLRVSPDGTKTIYTITALDPDLGDTVHYELVTSSFGPPSYPGPTVDAVTGNLGLYSCRACGFQRIVMTVAAVDTQGARTEQSFIIDLSPTAVAVPNVVNQLLPDARTMIEAASLKPLVVTELFGPQPAGTVVGQDPLAGTANVALSATVRLTVSKGPQPFTMPFVVGDQLAPTNARLTGAGLTVNVTAAFSTTIPVGDIMAQAPAAGTGLLPGSAPPVALMVSAGGPLPAPIASIVLEPGPGPLLRLAGDELQYTAVAILTDGTSADVTLTAAWSSSATSTATISPTGVAKAIHEGATTLSASLDGKTGQGTLNVAARASSDNTPPTAGITAPADGATVTGPVSIVGTASDTNFLRYELAYALAGEENYTLIAEGTTPVTDGTLGTLDPTTLVNDQYTLRLKVFDRSENESVTTRTVQLTGNRKIGLFSLTFEDLSIPMSGIPLTVSRTYDSRDKTQGDFGIGWRLGFQTLRLRTNRVLGTGWVRTVSGIMVTLSSTDEHKVSLTLPDGRVEEFDMIVSPTANVGSLDFTNVTGFQPRSGTLGQLQALGNNSLLIASGGAQVELVDDSTLKTYSPTLYRYTGADGTQIEISPTGGVQKVTDLNGNTVTFGPGGIIHSAGKSVTFTRDPQGRITQITDPLGNVQNYSYDGNGDLVGHVDAAGGVSKYAYNRGHGLIDMQDPAGNHPSRNDYDGAGRLIATTDANANRITITRTQGVAQELVHDRLGNPTVYDYDAAGNIVAQTDALGGVRTFTYDSRNNQLTETDPLLRVASKTYDSLNNLLASVDFDGNATVRTFNAQGQPLTITDPEGRITTNVFDAGGNLTQTTDPEGGITRFTYNGAGNLLTRTDPLNQVTTFTYDGAGNKLTETDPLGHRTTHTYDANGRMLSTTDANGNTEERAYDGAGRVRSVTDKLGNVTTFTHSPVGDGTKVATKTDALGRVTRYDYDAVGNLVGSRLPDGVADAMTYDGENRELTRTDRDGRTTLFQYDALGRKVRTPHPDGTFATTTWDAADRMLVATDERGNATGYTYAANRQTVTDALGYASVHHFDSKRQRIEFTDPLSRVTTFAYDSQGNLTRTTFPDATFRSTTYDAAKWRIAQTDEAGRSTQFGHDAAGRPIVVTDAAGGVTRFTYDAVGNRLTQTDANGNTTRSVYDAMGRVVSRTRPAGERESFVFNAGGQLLAHTDFNGQLTTFIADALGRVVQKNLPGGVSVPFSWTPTGLRTQAGGDGYRYDTRGRLSQETKASGATLTYTYDAVGNRTALTTPQGMTSYTYDAMNRLATVTDPAGTTTYGYDAAGNLATTAYPNGVIATHSYDTRNRLVNVTNRGPFGLISSYTYSVGPVGNRVQVVEAGPATAGRTVTYVYDSVYRLTQELIVQAPGLNVVIDYAYDVAGNRTQLNRNGTVTTNVYDSNDRLLTETTGATTFRSTYDDNGNLKSRGNGVATEAYQYDAQNRLIGVSGAAGAATFAYDADGMRTGRTVGGVTTTFLLDKARPAAPCGCAGDAQPPLAQVVVETRGAHTITYTYGHALIAQTQPGFGTSFYLADGQRSHRQLTNAAGAVTDTYSFDAFGVLLVGSGSTPNAYLYAGEQLDPNLGFYYLRARYYQQTTGRLVSTDPELGNFFDPMSLHRYLYAHANPVDNRDPSGRSDFNLMTVMAVQILAKSAGVGFIAMIGTKALGIAKDWGTARTYGVGFAMVGLTWFTGTAILAAGELAAAEAVATTAIPTGALNQFLLAVEAGEIMAAQTLMRSYVLRTFLFSSAARCVFLDTVVAAVPWVVAGGLTATATYNQGVYYVTPNDRVPLIVAGVAQLRSLAEGLGCK